MPALSFRLRSSAFTGGAPIPPDHTCDGKNIPPHLFWENAPALTRSFAVMMEQRSPDGDVVTHWSRFDIPGTATELKPGDRIGVTGRNDFQGQGYRGPCPRHNEGDRRYIFTVLALDVDFLGIGPEATRADIDEAMRGHIISQAALMGRYQR